MCFRSSFYLNYRLLTVLSVCKEFMQWLIENRALFLLIVKQRKLISKSAPMLFVINQRKYPENSINTVWRSYLLIFLLFRYEQVFADPNKRLPFNMNIIATIKTTVDSPIYSKLCNYPMGLSDFVNNEIESLLINGIIRPSCSPKSVMIME